MAGHNAWPSTVSVSVTNPTQGAGDRRGADPHSRTCGFALWLRDTALENPNARDPICGTGL